jgi:hypothetical protein
MIRGMSFPIRTYRVSGLWESFRQDSAVVQARDEKSARAKFRKRYKNPRSVTSVKAVLTDL